MSHLHTNRRVTSQSTTIASKQYHEDDEETGDESMLESEEEEEEEDESSQLSNSSDEEEGEDEEIAAEEERIRNGNIFVDSSSINIFHTALANVPFGQLMAIQRKMGIKAFNKKSTSKEELIKEETTQLQRKESTVSDELPATTKPVGKHRPIEMSSKKPVTRFRQVVESTKKKSRDPRFDRLSGHFNEDLFQKAYGFIDEYRQSELQQMKQQLKKTKKPEMTAELQREIKRMESKEASRQETKRLQEFKRRLRKEEAEKVKQGKKPYFIKQSEVKRLALVDKYEQLAKHEGGTAKLDRILEKRRKRNAAKERKAMPKRRRTVME
ncbi:hypothetical protein BDF22DRAFT_658346 [Syncephalis plumigaleata]|nr:hypothetical protein BDF22DRAFT_658346 [Syncephalis plumigaleata]